jgi:L-2-hydroxyglutarate oxidase
VHQDELARLEKLAVRARENGAHAERLDAKQLREREPHVAGIAALHVPEAGIVDFADVTRRLAQRVKDRPKQRLVVGARLRCATERGRRIVLETDAGTFESSWVVNCAGLQSDRVARMLGQSPPITIVPFRGDYYVLTGQSRSLVRDLIYPVPDPGLPFLGVHATRTTSGTIECGPNASLAMGREAYERLAIDPDDLAEILAFPGLWRLGLRFRSVAVREFMRSLSKRAFHRALTLLVPSARFEDLEPRVAGIRAQAMTPDGTLVDDFVIVESERVVSVCNAPSPAATASLAIAETIVNRLLTRV